MRYAQINSDNICIGISDLRGPVDAPNMISLSPGQDVMGQRYQNGMWAPVPVVAAPKTRVLKRTILDRLTDEEGDLIIAAYSEAPGKLRLIWDDASVIDQADPNYLALVALVTAVLGPQRAGQVLEPTE